MQEKTREGRSGSLPVQIIFSAVGILLGVLLLFVPQVKVTTLCYVFCGAVLAAGFAATASFFWAQHTARLQGNSFALGVMLLILGFCGLIRASELAASFPFFMGIAALAMSAGMLQSAIRLRMMRNAMWIVNLVLSMMVLLGSLCVLADFRPILDSAPEFAYWVLLISSLLNLIGLLIGTIGLRQVSDSSLPQEQDP